ncbi:TCP-1/cpn60 chaperonin family protein [Cupriavidus basilensis]
MRGTLKSCALKSPGFGEARTEQLADLAALTGATVISPQSGGSLESGARIVHTALAAPMRQIAENSGADAQAVVHQVCAGSGMLGYDASTDRFGDMLELGVIDPVRVVRTALQNAVSVASLMLTTDCMVAIRRTDANVRSNAGTLPSTFDSEY